MICYFLCVINSGEPGINKQTGGPTLEIGQKSCIHNHVISNLRKMKWSCAGHINRLSGPHVSPLGDHTTRKYDKGDQPNDGETAWTRYGRGQRQKG